MMKQKTTKHGGYRPGAGRKKTKPPTTTLSWRVPASIAPALKAKIDALIKKEIAKIVLTVICSCLLR
jgi:hypothetical protein